MILKQKTTALKNRDFPKGNNCSNDKFEHYQFGNNVLLDIPSYQNQKNNVPPHTKVCGLNGTCLLDDPKLKPVSYDPILKNGVLIYGHNENGHSSNVMLRLFIRDRFCDVPLQKCDFSKCQDCHAKTYNSGIEKHLCHDPVMCPAVNPAMTVHENFAQLGHRARLYPAQLKEDTNYA